MKNFLVTFLVLMLLFMKLPNATARIKWTFEALAGDAYCFQTPLTIKQLRYNDIQLKARYATNSFKLPIYHSVHISKWKGFYAR